ncbi:MAG TPA: peptidylprolyl isomerase [Terracidiphilus sp.]|nr:peptidylprolyl isomerase [Terracidiphilus sp.]
MTFRFLRITATALFSTALLATSALAQQHPAEPASPYGGETVEEIIARVNDQIITKSDYNRAMKELDDEARQRGASMQQTSDAHKDLLRNLIDQQLWLSKGKELGVTGETELVNRLDEIRKQYHLDSLEDLEKAAQEQGVSYEDFKANIRNQIITQQVMRDEVGRHISFTPGEVQRYFDEHKQDYNQPESVRLSEVLVATAGDANDAAVAAAKAKADDIVAKAKAGADFTQLAKSQSEGTTAAQGGDMGTYKRGQLAPIFENAVFGQPTGSVTDPIRTKQGFVIFKVVQHTTPGAPVYKDVEPQVEQDYYSSKMEPAVRDYLTKMREDAYLEIKPGYVDTGASPNKRVMPITYAAYTPPAPKKKKKVERTRFRENAHFRQKSPTPQLVEASANTTPETANAKHQKSQEAALKPGKKEKIRYGKAPTKTLPQGQAAPTEDAGAGANSQVSPGSVAESNVPDNPVEQAAPPRQKTRFSDRAKTEKKSKKQKGQPKVDPMAPAPPDAAEVATRQTQNAPLGLAGDTATKKKKKHTTTGEKTRLSDKKKTDDTNTPPQQPTPIPAVTGAPAPSQSPAQTPPPAPQQ